jgi:thiamine-phosphate pyrophosphorylase
MKRKGIDYSLYLVTDRELAGERSTHDIVKAAIKGGVTCVQLREKSSTTLEFIEQALSIRELLRKNNIPLIINDRLDVAQAVHADGVHLGTADMPLEMARSIVGNSMIIGASAESIADAIKAEKDGADYIAVSPIYETPTKVYTFSPLGLKGLREIRGAVKTPLVGIGGLNKGNSGEIIRNGADGIAVVSAIVAAEDPESAARELKEIIMRARIS